MNLALSIIANLLTNESGKEKVSEQNIKFLVSMLEEIVASELYDQLDLVTKTSIMSRTIRALGNAASSNESNLAKIHKLRKASNRFAWWKFQRKNLEYDLEPN